MTNEHLDYIDRECFSIVDDSCNIIWISIYGNGLYSYKWGTDEFIHYHFNVNKMKNFIPHIMLYLAEDAFVAIGVGTEYGIVLYLSLSL